MSTNRQTFQLSPEQIVIRNILNNKSFVEIEIWAISNADPNRNKSCFTLKGMEKGIKTFTDKPILGFFNKEGDFEQHNAKVSYDPELDQPYWDNTGGEQILGFIREKDQREIVEKDGLSWIRCTAMIYTQYNFNQVKRLLKDKNKKVSVEVDIIESEIINGIQYIYDFVLTGITILGSKGGVPIREGIEGAHLSVLDLLEKQSLHQQKEALVFAYAGLNEEEEGKKLAQEENTETAKMAEESTQDTSFTQQNPEEGAPATNGVTVENDNSGEGDKTGEDNKGTEETNKGSDDNSKPNTQAVDPEGNQCNFEEQCKELQMKCEEYEGRCTEYEQRCSDYEQRCTEYNAKLEEADKKYCDAQRELESVRDELNSLKSEFQSKKINEQMAHITDLACKMSLSEEDTNNITERCKNGQFTAVEDIDKEIAYLSWKKNFTAKTSKPEEYSVNIVGDTTTKKSQEKLSVNERLKQNINKQ